MVETVIGEMLVLCLLLSFGLVSLLSPCSNLYGVILDNYTYNYVCFETMSGATLSYLFCHFITNIWVYPPVDSLLSLAFLRIPPYI